MQSGQENHNWPERIMEMLSELKSGQAELNERVGSEENGGTGLFKRMGKIEVNTDTLLSERSMVIGGLKVLGLLGALFVIFGGWLVSLGSGLFQSMFHRGPH